jgi:hypothetical protein
VCFVASIGVVAACGHQVTSNPPTDALTGKIAVVFSTQGPMDFTHYTYAIVVDTCGTGPPLPNVYSTTFKNYSYAFLIGGSGAVAQPVLEQFTLTGSDAANPLHPITVQLGSSLTDFEPQYEGSSNAFELIFTRKQLDDPLRLPQPCPNITPVPGATDAPAAQPTTPAQATWSFNFFTIDATSGTVVDSLGVEPDDYSGANIATDSFATLTIPQPAGSTVVSIPAAAIAGGQIINYP